MVVDGRAEPIVFKQHRDKWAPELLQVIAEYDRAKLFWVFEAISITD